MSATLIADDILNSVDPTDVSLTTNSLAKLSIMNNSNKSIAPVPSFVQHYANPFASSFIALLQSSEIL